MKIYFFVHNFCLKKIVGGWVVVVGRNLQVMKYIIQTNSSFSYAELANNDNNDDYSCNSDRDNTYDIIMMKTTLMMMMMTIIVVTQLIFKLEPPDFP